MNVWSRIGASADAASGRVKSVTTWLGSLLSGISDPKARRQVAFSAAMIALSAKMAKADGVVTSREVDAFHALFAVPPRERRAVDRLFDLAKRDVAGFKTYASRIAEHYKDDRAGLEDVLDGLFSIAKADGAVHDAELAYLEAIAGIFGFEAKDFERICLRHVIPKEGDPYLMLGAERGWTMQRIRARYLALVAENHPDTLAARGLGAEFRAIANDRMAAINGAYARIERERAVAAR